MENRIIASNRVPLWLKLAYTAFMAVLVPVYWHYYGPTNFLYFCDLALLITLVGIWIESPLLVSMCAVGILAPQALWVADFLSTLAGLTLDDTLRPMLPAFLALLDVPVNDSVWLDSDPAQRRRRTLDACRALLLREALVQPTIVVF